MKLISRTILFLMMCCIFSFSFGQEKAAKKIKSFDPYFYAGLDGGIAQFYGDANSKTYFEKFNEESKFSGGLHFGYQICSAFGLRGQLQYCQLNTVKDEDQNGNNIFLNSVSDNVFEYSLQATLEFLNLFMPYNADRKITAYGFGGIGIANFETQLLSQSKNILFDFSTDAINGKGPGGLWARPVIPVGLGVAYRITPNIDLGLEVTDRIVFSDRMDALQDYSAGKYDDNSRKNDNYITTAITLTYNFRKANRLSKMRSNFSAVEITSDPEILVLKGNLIDFVVEGDVPVNYFDKNAVMVLFPTATWFGGYLQLKPIYIQGENVLGDGTAVSSKSGGSFKQSFSIPFQEGMCDLKVIADGYAFIPKGGLIMGELKHEIKSKYKYVFLGTTKLSKGTICTQKLLLSKNQDLSFAKHQYKKNNSISKEAVVWFAVDKEKLNLRLPLNKENNAKSQIEDFKNFLKYSYSIKDISLNAWASPEGEEGRNKGLSEGRVASGQKLLNKIFKEIEIDKSFVLINEYARGEDWEGFLDAVENSNLKDKSIILNVVKSQTNLSEREQEIRNMALIYKEVEDEILPPLRRVVMKATSYLPEKTDEEYMSIALSSPKELNSEQLMYAASLIDDENNKLSVYESVLDQNPKNHRAWLNAGNLHFKNENYRKAGLYLKKANELDENNPDILNSLGAVAEVEGDSEIAKQYFNEAKAAGADVSYKEGLEAIFNGDYGKAVNLLGNKKGDYNAALAHLLNGNAKKTIQILNDAEQTAETFYLKAISYARLNETAKVFENLLKSTTKDETIKERMRDDLEFVKYFNTPDFMNLLK